MIVVEACVTTLEEAIEAANTGAGRLELCRDLHTGGLSPSIDLVHEVSARVGISLNVMVRPHPGEFSTEVQNFHEMIRQITEFSAAGADGIVLGVLDNSQRIDVPALTELTSVADDLPVTFHRAFDEVEDTNAAAENLIEAGVSRVLTGGGQGIAWKGRRTLSCLVQSYGEYLTIIAGGSVRADHVLKLIDETCVREVHARASAVADIVEVLKAADIKQ